MDLSGRWMSDLLKLKIYIFNQNEEFKVFIYRNFANTGFAG